MQTHAKMIKKNQIFLIGCVLLRLSIVPGSGLEAGDRCDIVELAPHSSDCGKFLQCEHDRYTERCCPNDLHFNADIFVCDWPAYANCQLADIITEPFDEFGDCMEYTTGCCYGYKDFYQINDIGKQRADFVELKVFVRTSQNVHIMLTADPSVAGYEILNYNNEAYMLKQKSTTIDKASRYNLLESNEFIPFIIRIFDKTIEVQVAGERNPFLQATVSTAINVTLIGFGTSSNTIATVLYGCQVNPPIPIWPVIVPLIDCVRLPATPNGFYLKLADYGSRRSNENIELQVYVATSAETVTLQMSSTDYSPSGSPYYDIEIGKNHQIRRRFSLIASKAGTSNMFQSTKLVRILVTLSLAGQIQVSVNDDSKMVLNVIDTYPIDVQYVNFRAANDVLAEWYQGVC